MALFFVHRLRVATRMPFDPPLIVFRQDPRPTRSVPALPGERAGIVDVLAAGSEAVAGRDGAMRGFSQLILENVRAEIGADAPPALDVISETIVGGIYEVVYARVLRREFDELPRLLPDLVSALLPPFMGPRAALAEYRRLEAAAE